jgi:hypothetical protein
MTAPNSTWVYGRKIGRALSIASIISALSIAMVVIVELTVGDGTMHFPTTTLNVSLFVLVGILAVVAIFAQFFLWMSMIYFIAVASKQPVGLRIILVLFQLVLVSLASLVIYLTIYRPRLLRYQLPSESWVQKF